jgi:DnaJ-class molecular chaperone
MADPYQTLGVSRQADEATIKKAYRKLAKELHPDRTDNPKASERFAAATAAYDLLSDNDKRARYDRGEIDEDGNPTAAWGFHGDPTGGGHPFGAQGGFRSARGPHGAAGFAFSGDAADLGSMFEDLFGGGRGFTGTGRRSARAQKGPDVAYRLAVRFEDAATLRPQRVGLANGNTVEIELPVGVESGAQRRLSGQGEPGPGGPGDAIVTIEVQPHRFFTRDGDDVRLDLPVRLDEAVLGAKVKVPTVDGPVMLTIPKGSTSGRVLRVGGKGFHRRTGGRGNQLVKLLVDLPSGDPQLERFATEWKGSRSINPRAPLGV